MNDDKVRVITIIVSFVIVVGIALTHRYVRDQHNAKITAIMTGEVRGNKTTHIFHVPTCPQYGSIKPENLKTFETVDDAKKAGYRGAGNCEDAVDSRYLNETESYDPEPLGREDPRY